MICDYKFILRANFIRCGQGGPIEHFCYKFKACVGECAVCTYKSFVIDGWTDGWNSLVRQEYGAIDL